MEIYQIFLMVIGAISIIVANHNNKTAIVMQDSVSEENKKLLSKYLD